MPTMIDPNWTVVYMLLAFFLGMVGGVRLINFGNYAGSHSNSGNRMPPR